MLKLGLGFDLAPVDSTPLNGLRHRWWSFQLEIIAFDGNKMKFSQGCPVLDKSHLCAKRDFEIWAFKVLFSLDTKSTP